MRLLSCLVVALAADATVASTWLSKPAYNKWHETELERWLADHDVPYPTAADRKDLEKLVKDNWHSSVTQPYSSWDADRLQKYLGEKGYQAKKGTEKNKDSLVSQVKSAWHETEEQAYQAYESVKDWIFDSWTESQLKAFLDRHGIPNPQPRNRDTLLKTVRENYHSMATKAGQAAAYPGDWIYETWTESDLKAWLDERGYPAPQPSTRDKLIASVRRNSRIASTNMSAAMASASASAKAAKESITNAMFDSWTESQLKEWCDKNGVKVPQGSRRNDLLALARRQHAKINDETVASSASNYYGAATSAAGNEYARATDDASLMGNKAFSFVYGYFDWVRHKLGLYASEASASASQAGATASASVSSMGSHASKSAASMASSASNMASSASKSASSMASSASKSASSASDKASKSAASAKNKATGKFKEEL